MQKSGVPGVGVAAEHLAKIASYASSAQRPVGGALVCQVLDLTVRPFKVASTSQRRPASVPSVSLFTCYLDMSHRGRTIHLQVHWHLQFRIIREVTFSMRRLCVNPGDPYSFFLDPVSRCAYHSIQMTGGKQAALLKPSKHATGLLV